MVPAAIAAAITSAVTSVNKTSADISTPPSISPIATLTQSDIVSSPESTISQTPSLANAQTEKTKTPLISAVHNPFFPPVLPEVFEPMSAHTNGEIRTTPLLSANLSSTQFTPTSFHPMDHTFQNNSFVPTYPVQSFGNIPSTMFSSPYLGIYGYLHQTNYGNAMGPYIQSHNPGTMGFSTHISHPLFLIHYLKLLITTSVLLLWLKHQLMLHLPALQTLFH